jgi:hypothetical protein
MKKNSPPMNNASFPWRKLATAAHEIGLHYLRVLRELAPHEKFYFIGFDCIEDCQEILVAANTEECLTATGQRVFPLRPPEVRAKVLRWSMENWGYYDVERRAGDKYGLKRVEEFSSAWWELDQQHRSEPDGLERAVERARMFRVAVVSGLLRLRESREFARLPKTEDFQLVYWEHGNRPFKNEGEMTEWLAANPLPE